MQWVTHKNSKNHKRWYKLLLHRLNVNALLSNITLYCLFFCFDVCIALDLILLVLVCNKKTVMGHKQWVTVQMGQWIGIGLGSVSLTDCLLWGRGHRGSWSLPCPPAKAVHVEAESLPIHQGMQRTLEVYETRWLSVITFNVSARLLLSVAVSFEHDAHTTEHCCVHDF